MRVTIRNFSLAAPTLIGDYDVQLFSSAGVPIGNGPIVLVRNQPGNPPSGVDTIYYYDTDVIGSVRLITDKDGNQVARKDYLPFGSEWNSSSTSIGDRVKFGGTERDPDSGLDYMGARYYSMNIGRFMRPDDPGYSNPFEPQSMNLYGYARNNPLRFVDPTGHEPECAYDSCVTAPAPALDPGMWRFFTDSLTKSWTTWVQESNARGERQRQLWDQLGKDPAALRAYLEQCQGCIVASLPSAPIGRLLGPATIFSAKISRQLARRGWTEKLVERVIKRAVHTSPSINRANGNPATAYFHRSGTHVVRDNVTGEIVQVSNRLKPGAWTVDSAITKPFVP